MEKTTFQIIRIVRNNWEENTLHIIFLKSIKTTFEIIETVRIRARFGKHIEWERPQSQAQKIAGNCLFKSPKLDPTESV